MATEFEGGSGLGDGVADDDDDDDEPELELRDIGLCSERQTGRVVDRQMSRR